MSLDKGAPTHPNHHYTAQDFATFKHCKADTTTDVGEECSDFYSIKNPTSVTLKQTSTPSPSYPSANSWPGFGGRYIHGAEEIQVPTVDSRRSPSTAKCDFTFRQKLRRRVYVFSSKMANDAVIGVRQKKFESIIAWHEANCRPSTSKGSFVSDSQAVPLPNKKRCNVQDMRMGSPMTSCGTPSVCSPSSSTLLPVPHNMELNGNPSGNPTEMTSAELLNPDDQTDIGDNPLRRMERMTQDSLFEPPSKLSRTSAENNYPARREQDRNAKLEKMRTLEQQIMYDKARTEWDRMMHEHEAIKMARGYMPPLMANCSQASIPSPFPCNFPSQNGMLMQGPCRRAVYPQPMHSSEQPTSISNMNTPMIVPLPQTSGPNMPMSQPLRPSLNPTACSMQYTHCNFMCCPYPQNTYPTAQNYPAVNGSGPPCFHPNFVSNGGNIPSQSKEYSMYQQGARTMCPPEKLDCDMWNRQMPMIPADFETSFSDQKMQYHNNAIMNDKLLGAVASTNAMFA
ncbi:unnamed protein product [Thelazia callipaeda]|uniref:HMG box domain-containing protein n=1 Tax=Thelazia callipaeda TaxID=103827 RepID=A0A0N5D0N6_THECL|nr:unnamed protein product [Thelazia callipaeda]